MTPLKRKVSCTFKRETPLEAQERIYLLPKHLFKFRRNRRYNERMNPRDHRHRRGAAREYPASAEVCRPGQHIRIQFEGLGVSDIARARWSTDARSPCPQALGNLEGELLQFGLLWVSFPIG